MGNYNLKQKIYNLEEANDQNENQTNPYINPSINSFEHQTEILKDKTIISKIINILEENPNNESLGYRKPKSENEWESEFTLFKFSQIKNYAEILSAFLVKNNLCPKMNFEEDGDFSFLGIFSKNCFEWIITDIACQLNDITSATFYATLGDQAFDYIAKQTKLSTICISPENFETFVSYKSKFNIESIINVILFDFSLFKNPKNVELLKQAGLNVILFSEIISENSNEKEKKINEDLNLQNININNDFKKFNLAKPASVITICYTSGTTGIPKGVKLTQRSLLAQIESIFPSAGINYSSQETIIIYLPLAHIMERLNVMACLIYGVKCGFISGDVRSTLAEDIAILKPTIFVAVPRVLQMFREKILAGLDKAEGCKKSVALKALRAKRANFQSSNQITHLIYDKLVFSKIREKFGGKIKCFITGSAPLPTEVATDIKIFFSAPIIEAYGLTEISGACAVSHVNDFTNSSTGGAITNCKIKLVDVPEMNYHKNTELNGQISPTGEICIFGPILFNGYFANKRATEECLDKEGWFHSGDIGRIMPENKGLKIIDRKKEIFKLNQGEYIATSKLESIYAKSKYVSSICVYGNSYKTCLVAIIVPNRDAVFEFLKAKVKIKQKKLDEVENIESFFTDIDLFNEIKSGFDVLAKENNLNSLEKIVKFHISEKEFSIQNGCFTPTLKLARNVIAKIYEDEIKKLYDEL